jgi:penicillin-binding protein-related factor A (putative recombinase)
MNLKNRIKGKRSQKTGQKGEDFAADHLRRLGLLHVEPIETGYTVLYGQGGRVIDAFPKKKVSGDFTAMDKNGRYVHIEVKVHPGDRLIFSRLKKHQVEAMDNKTRDKAICLLVWVRSRFEIKAMIWPIKGFEPGKSLKWEEIR